LKEVQLLKFKDVRTIRPARPLFILCFTWIGRQATITIRTVTHLRRPYNTFISNRILLWILFSKNAVLTKKLQTIPLLLGMKHKHADAMIGDLVCSSDFHTAYLVLGGDL